MTELLKSLNLQLIELTLIEVKLALLLEQVKTYNFIHLSATQNLSAENPAVPFTAEKCVEALEMLKVEFGV